MAVERKLTGKNIHGGMSDAEFNTHFGHDGVVVYNSNLFDHGYATKFLVNGTYGAEMNQNVTFGGTPVGIYDGGDTVQWAISTLIGNTDDFTEESTGFAHSGTKSLGITASESNDEAQMEAGSPITVASYTAITGWIYITKWPKGGTKDHAIRIRLAGTNNGVEVDISSYIDSNSFNVWQQFAIPLDDFVTNIPTFDQFVIRSVDQGRGAVPDVYFDDIQLEETGDPIKFTYTPTAGEVVRIDQFALTMVNNVTEAASMAYDSFMGVSATIGIHTDWTAYNGSLTPTNNSFHRLIDFIQSPSVTCHSGSDGTNSWLKVIYDLSSYPILMTSQDHFTMTINDDMSGLLFMRGTLKENRVLFDETNTFGHR
jgi:hypothetical protein